MTGLAAALFVCAFVGGLVDRVLLGDPSRDPAERLGRAWMLGFGVVATWGMVLDAVGLGAREAGFVATVLTAVLLGVVEKRRVARWSPDDEAPSRSVSVGERAAIVGLAVVALVSLALCVRSGWLRPTFQFDAVTRWMFKAKAIALDGTLLGPLSTDPLFAFTHQRYPPLVSHVAALPSLFGGGFDDRIASAMFPWFAVSAALVGYGAVARRVGALSGAFAAAWIATLPLVAYMLSPPPGSGAFSAMADIPLGLYVLGATFAAADAVDGRRDRAHVEAGLLLAFAMLTKNEGLPLAAGLGLGLVVLAPRAKLRRAVGVVGLAGAVYLLAWGLLSQTLPALDEHYPDRLNVDAVGDGLGRVPLVLEALGRELVDVRRWNVTWIAALVLLVAGWRKGATRGLSIVPLVVVVQVAAYTLAYVVTSWTSPAAEASAKGGDPLEYLLTLTLGRLMLHVAFVTVACAVCVAPLRWPSAEGPVAEDPGPPPGTS